MPDMTPEASAAGGGQARQIPLSSLPAPTQALPVLSAQQAEGLRALPWRTVSVQSDGRHIVVVITASTQSVKGVQIKQDPEEVSLVVYGTPPRATYSAGPLVHSLALVELPEALGSRRLAGASTGDRAD